MQATGEAPVTVNCKWDFCSDTFDSFAEWETHFTVEHIAYAQPIDLSGRQLSKREKEGEWELVDVEPRPTNQLPIDPDPSQTTADITTTTHTLSFPMPPSFHSLPDPPSTILEDMLRSDQDQLSGEALNHQDMARRATQQQENDAKLYQSFLRSPSPVPGRSGSISQSGSGSGSMQPPPPGQRPKTPPWNPSQPLTNSQNTPVSQIGTPSVSSSNPSNPTSTQPPPLGQSFPSPLQRSQDSAQVDPTPSLPHSSQDSPLRPRADSMASQAGQGGNIPLKFGAALHAGEAGSPFKDSPKGATSKSKNVGFDWGFK